MNVIFFGTSEFAVSSLKAIAESEHKVLAVVSTPDTKAGRGMRLLPSPLKEQAEKMNLEIYQPDNLLAADFISLLKLKNADVFVVIAYGKILPKEVLEIPKKCCVNSHPSLLPKYRGAAPCNWAVINGDTKTAVSIIKMNQKMDAGDIITSQTINISENDTSETIYRQLAIIGAGTVLATLDLIQEGKDRPKPQNEAEVTYAPKLKKQDGLIDWTKDADKIKNLIRGLQPWPGAYTHIERKVLKIYKAEKVPRSADASAGQIIDLDKKSLIISCGKDALSIKEIQAEGKKRMKIDEFLRGAQLKVGQKLGT